MLENTITILKDKLNAFIVQQTSIDTGESRVNYIQGLKNDITALPPNSVIPILVHAEEDKIMREADPYLGRVVNGKRAGINPEIRLRLRIMFAVNFQDYTQSMKYLSYVISCFQSMPVINHENTPELSEGIDHLWIELVSTSVNEQYELWNALKAPMLPSVFYRVSMLTYVDTTSSVDYHETKEVNLNVNRIP